MTHPVPNRKSPSKPKPAAARAVTFTGKLRRYLRSVGHGLAPVVQIGKSGLSAGVKEELDRALSFHELIKVRLLAECPIPREEAGTQIATLTRSELIQTLGGVLLLYRGRPEKPRRRSSASLACSRENSSTSVCTGTCGARARNSCPSRLVRLATERITRSPQRSS